MRRFARILFYGLTAISLALFLAICAITLRSMEYTDTWPTLTRDGTLIYPMSYNHDLQLVIIEGWRGPMPAPYHGRSNGFGGDWGRFGARTPKPGERGRQPQRWSFSVVVHAASGWSGDVPGGHVEPGGRYVEYTMPGRGMYIEHWGPAFLTALLPAAVMSYWTRHFIAARRRRNVGRCAACGYDLRASTVRCPECGETIPDGTTRLTERSHA